MTYFLQQGCTVKNSPDSTTNRGPSVQMSKPVQDISHSNHHKGGQASITDKPTSAQVRAGGKTASMGLPELPSAEDPLPKGSLFLSLLGGASGAL